MTKYTTDSGRTVTDPAELIAAHAFWTRRLEFVCQSQREARGNAGLGPVDGEEISAIRDRLHAIESAADWGIDQPEARRVDR